jgi:hypothetical protein
MKIPMDKQKHLFYGGAIAAAYAVLRVVLWGSCEWWEPALVARAIGDAKEGLDWLENHKRAKSGLPAAHSVEWADSMATFAGGAGVSAVCFLLVLLLG